MSKLKPLIEFMKRRTLTTIFLAIYFIWWILCFNLFHRIAEEPRSSCGAANGMLLILIFLVFVIYSIITLTLMLINVDQKRKDFTIAFLLVLFPFIIAVIDIMS